ncbi:helix-turn-helix domain-containing protein [Nocardia sp. GCM10030253]|uniref:helix-turn-helix domain-containing protein n=1 Tax=Nocardia sp. GCM10030253 TaxID=3273404 RepID=UPI00362B572C
MSTGSTLPRRILARLLRERREAAGIAAETARKAIGVSKQTFWRMETGQPTRINPLFITHLAQMYDVDDRTTDVLLGLTEESQGKGWWHAYGDTIPKHFDLYVGLEDAAKRFSAYQVTLLPGLLQTPEYRRQMIWTEIPAMATSEVERRIEIHTRRQARLASKTNPLTVNVLLDEAVLRRVAGSPQIMSDQLRHLVEADHLPNVSVRVVPLAAGLHKGASVGSFILLEFPRHPTAKLTEPPVIYVQGFTGALYLEKPDEVDRYRDAYADVQRVALDEKASRNLILEISEELTR